MEQLELEQLPYDAGIIGRGLVYCSSEFSLYIFFLKIYLQGRDSETEAEEIDLPFAC